jgi:ERCC4-related helicase
MTCAPGMQPRPLCNARWSSLIPGGRELAPVNPTAVDATSTGAFPPGAQVRIRDEQWLVRQVTETTHDGSMLEVTGVSPFVRGVDAVFYTKLEQGEIEVLDPRRTRLVGDDSPHHRRARLHLEAVIRKTALPQTEPRLALAGQFLMHHQDHQLRPAELALSMRNPQPRLLIADVVGLGKTLEIGVLLAELIRRGRGERILVVSPAHVLEQFQRELWTRFSIPLVRLDSTGVQRLQQQIPAGRNPFAYIKRGIISVDTLKREEFRHHVDSTTWDAVVIDESHNLVNAGTRNNDLARALARQTDALVLASATPHNGDATSFAELISLLDEAAIANPKDYRVRDLEHLYIRRTKTSPEVRAALTGRWADRGPSIPIEATATSEERAVLDELARRWIGGGDSPSSSTFFPWTMLKAFLSSQRALSETIRHRLADAGARERAALEELAPLVEGCSHSSKLEALVEALRDLGVRPGSDVRVVVFSERIPTLRWLADEVPRRLGFRQSPASDDPRFRGAVEVMHGDATAVEQQKAVIERFGLRDAPVRLLFTGDIASEGVNLHAQCHQLIHYDLPWSLIRIEQRNGRIDRYGQRTSPEFRAILLTSDVEIPTDAGPRPFDDRLVGAKVLAREEEAHRIEGSAEAATGLHRPKEEDDRLTRDLIAGRPVEQALTRAAADGDFLVGLLSGVGATPGATAPSRADVPALFAGTEAFFDEALREICPTGPEDELSLRRDDDGTVAFTPPPDLVHRLRALPRSYLQEQGVLGSADKPGRLRITFSPELGERRLQAARDSSDTQWPSVSFVSPIHPVLDWVVDKALAALRYDEAFVVVAGVDEPVVLMQGIYSNALGRPTVVEWMAVAGLLGTQRVELMDAEYLRRAGVGPTMAGRGHPRDLDGLKELVPAAVDAARRFLDDRRSEYDERVESMLMPYRHQVHEWRQAALFGAEVVSATADRRTGLLDAMHTAGAPMLRVLAVLEPAR